MIFKKGLKLCVVITLFFLSGCATIPQESVTLSMEIGLGITSIHESNIGFVEKFFDNKKESINALEEQAIDSFFNKIIAGTKIPKAEPIDMSALKGMQAEIEKIHKRSNQFKDQLDKSKMLLIKKLNENYHTIISANSSITGLLQSAVDVDKATNDGLVKIRDVSGGQIDLTKIEAEVDKYLSKAADFSVDATNLVNSLNDLINKGEK
ncbi:hypothetical protein KKI24_24390 [bacterium]|nr:hypothetical protein [bacterium]